MSLAEVKEEIQRMSAEELLEVEKILRIQRVVKSPGYRERITRSHAEIEAGKKVTQEQVEAFAAQHRLKKT